MKTYITLFILAAFAAINLHSCIPSSPCNEDDEPIHKTYNLSPDTKSKIPYRADGLDTLVYISDEGDTATLYGQGRENYYTTDSKNRNPDPDCPLWDTWRYENIEYVFNGTNDSFKNLQLKYEGPMDFRVNTDNGNIGYTTSVKLNDTLYYDTSIVVNGRTFLCKKLNPIPPDTVTFAVYHFQFGIIKLRQANQIWTSKF